MEMRHRAKCLHAHDQARHGLSLADGRLDVAVQRAGGDSAQQPQPAPILEEVRAQPFRQRQHHLAVRHRGEQALVQPQAPLGEPPRVARRTEVAPLATKRHQELGPAGTAAHAGEAVLEQPAVEEPADCTPRSGPWLGSKRSSCTRSSAAK